MACADCGCVVDRGVRVDTCAAADCCCRHVPLSADIGASQVAPTVPDPSLGGVVVTEVGPTWTTAREAFRVVVSRRHLRATTRIVAVVGTVLFAINQLDVVLSGRATTATWVKVAVTYLVPFAVSNLGILTATRRTGP